MQSLALTKLTTLKDPRKLFLGPEMGFCSQDLVLAFQTFRLWVEYFSGRQSVSSGFFEFILSVCQEEVP